MTDFLVKFNSEEELINGLIDLNEIGALGIEINFGTCMNDTYNVKEVIKRKVPIYEIEENENDIYAFCVCYDNDEYRNKNFPLLYGKNHIIVALATHYDERYLG